MSRYRGLVAAAAVALVPLLSPGSAAAQEEKDAPADSVVAATAPDSVQSIEILPPREVQFLDRINRPLSDSIPARHYAFELADLLKDEPASFLYDFSNYGWPHVWAPYGLAQQNVGLEWNGIELHDLFTGRTRLETPPFGSSHPPDLIVGQGSRLAVVALSSRPYERQRQPLTEFRYQAGGGLQKVTALHTQNRRLNLGGDGILNLLFWYRGEGASGEYPGSRLRRGRQIHGRLLYARPRWSFEISELHTRHPLEAHGGVLPRAPGDFDSIYQRIGARVEDEGARRRTVRNDLFGRWRRTVGSRGETSLLFGRSTEDLQFRRPGDTLEVVSSRNFASLAQQLALGAHVLSAEISGAVSRSEAGSDTLGFGAVTDRKLHMNLTERFARGELQARATVGVDTRSEGSGLASYASVHIPLGPAALSLDAATRPETATVMELTGFGPFLTVEGSRRIGSTQLFAGRLSLGAGPIDVSLIGSLTSSRSWRDYFATASSDSVRLRPGEGTLSLLTSGVDFGFRRHSRRGLYLTAKPTLFSLQKKNSSDLERFDASLPDLYVVGRLGARYLIFDGDLNLDLSVRGRFWSEFRSRTLHTPTGLLALPSPADRPVEASAALDFVVEGRVRDATLFLAYENFLSGTTAVPGNLLVPVYPLAEGRLRFGVFWPIEN